MNRFALSTILLASAMLPVSGASAAQLVYEAALSGANEAPPIVSPGTGFTTVTYDDFAHTLRVQFTFADLIGTTTGAHIHVLIPPALTGGVATQVPSFGGFPLGVTSGNYDSTFDLTMASSWNPVFITNSGGTPSAAEAAFAEALSEGRTYLNIHTNSSPGGEIRGTLVPASATGVPEPGTWALLLFGFGLAGAALRRRAVALQAVATA